MHLMFVFTVGVRWVNSTVLQWGGDYYVVLGLRYLRKCIEIAGNGLFGSMVLKI